MGKETKLLNRIEKTLKKSKILFKKQIDFEGIRLDFVAKTPSGENIVIEAKSWKPTKQNRKRAIKFANYFRKKMGADKALIIIEGLRRSIPEKGIITQNDLLKVLEKAKKGVRGRQLIKPKGKERPKKKQIFVAMPFSAEYDDTFLVAIRPAAKSVNATCVRIDRTEFEGDIPNRIKKDIKESDAIIADLSESNPNVLYEIGYGHGNNLKVIQICSTPLKDLPFDVRNIKTIEYKKGQTHRLKKKLKRNLKSIFK